jgi:hypothetical protein
MPGMPFPLSVGFELTDDDEDVVVEEVDAGVIV